MPEGDTIHTIARVMSPDLVGRPLVRLALDKLAQPWAEGAVAMACDAVGKHLVIPLAAPGEAHPRTLRVHLGMKGSWHRYRPGEPWRRPAFGARVELHTERWVFVCFGPKEVEVVLRHGPRPDVVGHLGPDLLGATIDFEAVLGRARAGAHRDAAIGDLLLTQTVAAGIGNVYKCEVLFVERVEPWTPVNALADEALLRLYRRARELMQDNVAHGGWRTTMPRGVGPTPGGERHWVYRRAGLPCRVCGTLVVSRLQGAMARRAYWCTTCQVDPSRPTDPVVVKGP